MEYGGQCDYAECWQPVAINLSNFKKTVFEDAGGPVFDLNTISFSKEQNIFLYSLNGDIKIYNMNTKNSYGFISTDAYEHTARFVNQN